MKCPFVKASAFTVVAIFSGAIFATWPSVNPRIAEAQIIPFSNSSPSNAAPPREPFVDDFVPEFRDLPDFDENAPKFEATLVDVRGVGNNYYPDEVIAKTGEPWFGLFWNRERLEFHKTKVTVKIEDRPNHGYENSVTLRFSRKVEPIFIIKDAENIREGEIVTLESSIDSVTEPPYQINTELTQGFRKKYTIDSKKYILRVTSGLQRDGGKVNVLVLESEGKSQILTFNRYYKDHTTLDNSIGDLLWIGDMDGDERLDLYFSDYGYEKGGFGSNLFLSSSADQGKLVKQVAAFGTAGC